MNNGLSTPVDQTLSEFFVGTTPSKPHTNTFRQSLLTDGKTEAREVQQPAQRHTAKPGAGLAFNPKQDTSSSTA